MMTFFALQRKLVIRQSREEREPHFLPTTSYSHKAPFLSEGIKCICNRSKRVITNETGKIQHLLIMDN